MSNTELANFGLFMVSILGFGIGTLILGSLITGFDSDDLSTASWLVGCIVFGIEKEVTYGK